MGILKVALVANALKGRGEDVKERGRQVRGGRDSSNYDDNYYYEHADRAYGLRRRPPPPPPPPGQYYQQQPQQYYQQQPQYYQPPPPSPQGYGGPPPPQSQCYHRGTSYKPQDNYGPDPVYGHSQQGPPPSQQQQQQQYGPSNWSQYAYPPASQNRSPRSQYTTPPSGQNARPREIPRDTSSSSRGPQLIDLDDGESDLPPPPYHPRDEKK